MPTKYTIEMTYEQLLEFQSYLMWSTTSYKDKTMLELVMKMVKEIQLEKDAQRQEQLDKNW
jgi:hypothetical protein